MCDMPHAILLLEGTLRTLCTMLLVLRAHVLQKGKMAMRYHIARVRATTTAAQAASLY